MFAPPPPVQLTRAEISRRAQRHSGTASPGGRSSISSSAAGSSLHRTESNTSSLNSPPPAPSGRKKWFFGGGGKAAVTSPGPPPEPPAGQQHPGERAAAKRGREEGEKGKKTKTLSEAFGENPRKAPVPPKRPPRRGSEGIALPGAFPTAPLPAIPTLPQRAVPPAPIAVATPAREEVPPPVPDKSPKRLEGARARGSGGGGKTSPVAGRVSKGTAGGSQAMRRRSGSFGNRIEKNALVDGARRKSAAAYLRAAVADAEDVKSAMPPRPPRRATDGELQTLSGPVQAATGPQDLASKRRQKGETMSMLLNDGFFPVQEYIYSHKNPNISVSVPVSFPPPLSLLDKELPDTPGSIVPTPTELYQVPPVKVKRPVVQRKKGVARRRSPLAQLSVTDPKSNSARVPPVGLTVETELSPSRLSAIPEGSSVVSENTPPGSASGMSTPLATKIHLRGGSVITLQPPELTAWKQTCYLQGPIKLPKPTILPRKGSTASMDAFQEVVDQVYQEALNIPRRRSDDQIVDDICEFFDDFCFDEVNFDGDVLVVEEGKVDEMEEIREEMSAEIERFATPPNEMEATPVEKVIARDVVEHTILLPPVETEETLRARGIARLSQGAPPSPTTSSSRASFASRKDSTVLPLFAVPEKGMLDVPPTPALPIDMTSKSREDLRAKDRPTPLAIKELPTPAAGADQGFDWDDDVEELDALSSWVAPAALPKKYGMQRNISTRESKNPMKRMRRLVATASAIL